MSQTSQYSDGFVKSVVASAVVVAGDKFILNNDNLNSSLMLAGSTAAGIYAGSVLGSSFALDFTFGMLPSGKGLTQRVVEVGGGVAGTYILNNYVLKNGKYKEDMYSKLALIAAADIIGEYACDYMAGRPLSILQ